jgi:recombination protein RecA
MPAKKAADETKTKKPPAKKKAPAKKKTTTKKPQVGKMGQITTALSKVFKDKMGLVDLDVNARKKSHPFLPTGSIIVDWVIGGRPNENGVPPCPGLPKGRVVNLYGDWSSGKTTLALTTAATTIANGGRVCFVDWENAIDLRYASALGIPQDPEKFLLAQPTDLETGIGIIHAMAKAGIELIIIDSVGAGVPKKLMDVKLEEIGEVGRIGLKAAIWGAYLPKLKEAISKSGSTVIGISQLRDKISTGPSGKSAGKQAEGGNAWRFYSELRIRLRPIAKDKGKVYSALENKMVDKVIGTQVRIKLDKIKVAPNQGAEADFYIRYGTGIDDVRSIIGIASAHNIIHKSGSWYTWERAEEEDIRRQGADKLREAILDTEGAWEELYTTTLETMSAKSMDTITPEDDAGDADLDLSELDFLTDVEAPTK